MACAPLPGASLRLTTKIPTHTSTNAAKLYGVKACCPSRRSNADRSTPNTGFKKRVPYVLELVGLENKGRRLPNELSGGEQQRVAIARALVNNPSMIIADEPTGNLDPARSLEIMMLLERINALGTTVMVVTHEKELVNRFTKRVVAINEGKVISDGMDGYYLNEEE